MRVSYVGLGLLNQLALGLMLIWCHTAHAQVTHDGTTNTTVKTVGNDFAILNGIEKGNNLFHSFSNFSVPTGGSATFDLTNTPNITTIFSRVTGGNISHIDGLIQTLNGNHATSLFLMNPNGIIFGENARLNIGGSFVGTTANSIKFADGVEFSAVNANTTSLLTMSVPVGLQMGSNPGAITVQGSGHDAQTGISLPVSEPNLGTKGLQLQPGKTLALVGGNVALAGGLLWTPGGRIELGSITNSSVVLNSIPQGFTLSYPNPASFGDIQITQKALASTRDSTGKRGGDIQIQGKQVSIRDGSLILVQNLSNQTAGNIAINATESLDIIGKSPDFNSSSGLVNETISSGAGGNIIITTPRLNIDQGGYILNRTFSTALGGNIALNTDQIRVNGFAIGDPSPFRAVSQIFTASFGTGKGGNIAISTQNLSILAGANVAARPYDSGNGGDVVVKADTIQVTGEGAPDGLYFSLLSTATFGLSNAGDLKIDTRTLSVQAGGRVSASSIILGNAGSLTINASELIDVSGVKNSQSPSYIGTAVIPVFGVSNANSGNTTINTPVLNISNGATVFIRNTGSGNAGTLNINANTLRLDNGASISASTAAGEGGNTNLQLRDLLIMRNGSFINAEAGGSGNSGNITINAPIIVGLENSDIIANAVKGRGGNIQIATQGIIGLEYRNLLNPREVPSNDVTASSQFNVSGTVQINNIGVDPNSGLVELPGNVTDSSQQIATGCADTTSSSFVATGRGGIPQNPNQQLGSDVYHGRHLSTWSDIRDISAYRQTKEAQAQVPKSSEVLVQSIGWRRNANGKIELIGAQSPAHLPSYSTCTAGSQS
ncbi:S-layer family protein [Anabaena cylindrica FACHB-243]|uniref:Filamentous hemagglutinin family outer membrane protein n=1 Tax=Anabaena cylindrica (strain ATCC 27899 / PCC 7122) TaxID=272123 RepID=K9Z9E6_ANACC|nr:MULTISPECIES: S-layer family protein [Anabaena]AFZ55786.1 filamentous hemagglutinin family outer membrane protein [Anabaena cylindrica PCC 7122]MBD2420212.1 S-layer family protein [Anabaena cylindrica FACHB-243]MBY5283083.1 S-layer family protein [Anabaena sp. CCAP 1446/1C]MBY5307800.1 S-layer family protein [Anabaena sp. CCAP 1446/1C]MCM2406136.1 S-layer family protein [Anabaena sp. CCAP 1446/1C]